MKTVLTKSLALGSIALLALASCKKNDVIVKTNGGTAGTLSANTTTLPLDKTRLNDTTKVINFSFSKAAFGFSAAFTNTLQIDPQGDNWANPTSVTLGNHVYSQGYSTNDFNALVLKLNLPAGVASQVNVRLQSSLGGAAKPLYSNVISLTVTPFNLTSWLYITGAFSGWQNPGPQEDSLVSVTGNGVYTGIINFTAGNNQFLILPAKNWNHKYATNDAQGSTSATVTYDAPNNLYAPSTAGQYIVTFNSNTGTISFALADYYTIIGSATPGGNWSTDLPLKYINDGSNNWTGTFSLLAGQFKFRQDGQWSNSWGIPQAGTEGAGVANTLNDTKNDNINVTAGTHTVSIVMPATAQGSGSPPVTTTYSLQ
ncbi:MAG TPA: SusE domain-containing protein [Mucilaginibacter sp.]|nr:SusE domain-containing protein [Mucilaginibacter sp.]